MVLEDIDEEDNYGRFYAKLRSLSTQNFAVVFDAKEASCTDNFSAEEVSSILQDRHKDNEKQPCLWLNLWGWHPEHQEIVKILAKHYGISPRLTHFLCPRPNVNTPDKASREGPEKATSFHNPDPLDGSGISPSFEKASRGSIRPRRRMPTSVADIANDLWHFATVDFGHRYTSICWNALFFLPHDRDQNYTGKPAAIRVWSSLLLCDDGTVISAFESPIGLSEKVVEGIRNNQLNIFAHLSKYGAHHSRENVLMQIAIRPFHSSGGSNISSNGADMASLLFYYLFDDWVSIYYQAVGGENSYRNQLETLRQRMTESADVNQVTTLHRIGRELSVLRAVYQSYQSIIERLVQRHRRLTTQANSQGWSGADLTRTRSFWSGSSTDLNDASESGNQLARSTIIKFERLLDRIFLYTINEVDECLKEKDDLVTMVCDGRPWYSMREMLIRLQNFNLVALKESQAVEKLTRVTVLLAKVTILFLPISLTTGYFSMQFKQIDDLYSLRTYWFSFLVVAILTILFLLIFGILSDRYEGKIIFMPLTKIFLGRRRRSQKHVP